MVQVFQRAVEKHRRKIKFSNFQKHIFSAKEKTNDTPSDLDHQGYLLNIGA